MQGAENSMVPFFLGGFGTQRHAGSRQSVCHEFQGALYENRPFFLEKSSMDVYADGCVF